MPSVREEAELAGADLRAMLRAPRPLFRPGLPQRNVPQADLPRFAQVVRHSGTADALTFQTLLEHRSRRPAAGRHRPKGGVCLLTA